MNTLGVRLNFGKYDGQYLTRVPSSYLEELIIHPPDRTDVDWKRYAQAELSRRSNVPTYVNITKEAIDRMTVECYGVYLNDRRDGEGLYSWMERKAVEAFTREYSVTKQYRICGKCIFVMDREYAIPMLMSVKSDE